MFTGEKDKQAAIVRLKGRIKLLSSKGEQNANLVKSLKRELRNLEK